MNNDLSIFVFGISRLNRISGIIFTNLDYPQRIIAKHFYAANVRFQDYPLSQEWMNYLAHLILADDTDASRIGNLLGDFTRGTISSLEDIYPTELVRGIQMHRAVDRFTDSHPVFKSARKLLSPDRQRFAGVILDIIFDHYLSIHWHNYYHQPLELFTRDVYQALDEHPEWRAGRLAQVFPRMKEENWLMTYTTVNGIELTLQRVSRRGKRTAQIAGGIHDLRENYAELEAHFQNLMPCLLDFAKTWKNNH